MGKFEDLRVWQRSKDLSVKVYRITSCNPIDKDFGMKDQIRRASVSIPSNIAEGDESGTSKMAVKYFYMAKGSLAELFTQVLIAHEVGYLEDKITADLTNECKAISSMLTLLIRTRSIKPTT
jgi:four helix bundle protein